MTTPTNNMSWSSLYGAIDERRAIYGTPSSSSSTTAQSNPQIPATLTRNPQVRHVVSQSSIQPLIPTQIYPTNHAQASSSSRFQLPPVPLFPTPATNGTSSPQTSWMMGGAAYPGHFVRAYPSQPLTHMHNIQGDSPSMAPRPRVPVSQLLPATITTTARAPHQTHPSSASSYSSPSQHERNGISILSRHPDMWPFTVNRPLPAGSRTVPSSAGPTGPSNAYHTRQPATAYSAQRNRASPPSEAPPVPSLPVPSASRRSSPTVVGTPSASMPTSSFTPAPAPSSASSSTIPSALAPAAAVPATTTTTTASSASPSTDASHDGSLLDDASLSRWLLHSIVAFAQNPEASLGESGGQDAQSVNTDLTRAAVDEHPSTPSPPRSPWSSPNKRAREDDDEIEEISSAAFNKASKMGKKRKTKQTSAHGPVVNIGDMGPPAIPTASTMPWSGQPQPLPGYPQPATENASHSSQHPTSHVGPVPAPMMARENSVHSHSAQITAPVPSTPIAQRFPSAAQTAAPSPAEQDPTRNGANSSQPGRAASGPRQYSWLPPSNIYTKSTKAAVSQSSPGLANTADWSEGTASVQKQAHLQTPGAGGSSTIASASPPIRREGSSVPPKATAKVSREKKIQSLQGFLESLDGEKSILYGLKFEEIPECCKPIMGRSLKKGKLDEASLEKGLSTHRLTVTHRKCPCWRKWEHHDRWVKGDHFQSCPSCHRKFFTPELLKRHQKAEHAIQEVANVSSVTRTSPGRSSSSSHNRWSSVDSNDVRTTSTTATSTGTPASTAAIKTRPTTAAFNARDRSSTSSSESPALPIRALSEQFHHPTRYASNPTDGTRMAHNAHHPSSLALPLPPQSEVTTPQHSSELRRPQILPPIMPVTSLDFGFITPPSPAESHNSLFDGDDEE
ncbi:uncharacterized protein STEHIDRAFT_157728 [Stereum hirsutum FP-91666 SS1]|uniref:uncharacterized protein n=1 Tax=Stereum hirsutum (strain FP-91666) TaxID=721885 RepID=UPI000444A176|nr:uncharacterized protein STEHIDRAFT_157728 [Stereum hirsutum FP-91666 SS1]EIM86224.1 hypothetical protein STEHIDRAFT_157728 [Stereum hirsutum FP-91666 SS1]